MKVLFVSRSYAPIAGGMETAMADLAKGLSEGGDEVRVLTASRVSLPGAAAVATGAERERLDGIEIERFRFLPAAFLSAPRDGRRALSEKVFQASLAELESRVFGLLDSGKADLVHNHGVNDESYYLCQLRLRRPFPLLVTCHGINDCAMDAEFARVNPYRREVASAIFEAADRISLVSAAMREPVLTLSRAAAAKIEVIPNGVRVTESALPGDPAPAERIVFVGRLSPEKDPFTLLRAFAALRARRPAASLVFVGDGPLRAELEAETGRIGLAGAVSFRGELPRREAIAEMRASRLLALPSLREGCPMVLLEAMSHGVAVVASRIPAVEELARHGEHALLFEPGSSAALASALEGALADPSEIASKARRALEMAREKYNIFAVCGAYRKIYRGLLSGGVSESS